MEPNESDRVSSRRKSSIKRDVEPFEPNACHKDQCSGAFSDPTDDHQRVDLLYTPLAHNPKQTNGELDRLSTARKRRGDTRLVGGQDHSLASLVVARAPPLRTHGR
jgi:hypothetical protein